MGLFGCLSRNFRNPTSREAWVRCIVDLYDNFESFKSDWVPAVLPRFKRAVQSADGVTCVSHSLAKLIASSYGRQGASLV